MSEPTPTNPLLQPPPYALNRDTLENEVRIDTYRASGPGGQHVNKANSAIRLTHAPSSVVVIAQDSSSQFRNKEIAFERFFEKLTRLNHVPKKHFATKPSRAAKEKRIVEKKSWRSEIDPPQKCIDGRMKTITVHLTISGRVQGVGFRESMKLVAEALDVTRWV